MKRIAAAALVATFLTLPALAQVDCGAPVTGAAARYAEGYARDLTLPLIEHNAHGLGPVLWTYIAGQAQAESGLKPKDGGFVLKPGLNLWNTQEDAKEQDCSSVTVVACLDQKNPVLVPQANAKLGQCWQSSEGEFLRRVKVCFTTYPTLGAAADRYVTFLPNYTPMLEQLAKGNPTPQQFLDALEKSGWADKPNRQAYLDSTKASITRAMRGLATVRQTDTGALANTSKEIDAWCAQSGKGDPAQRAALNAKQSALLKTLGSVGKVCTAPAGSAAPAANRAIDTCRTEPDPPPPAPSDGPPGAGGASGTGASKGDRSAGSDHRPSGYATGTGEPHYRLPGGQSLTTQRAGEFWLLDSPDGVRIQVRQVPWRGSRQVAAIGAIAAQVGEHRVGVYADGRVLVDGKTMTWSSRFQQQALGQDAVVGVWGPPQRPSQVAVMWRNGRTLRVHLRSSWLDIETSWARRTDISRDRGLIGRASSTAAGMLIGRNGQRGDLGQVDQADAFVTSWRTDAKESLFDYLKGESHAMFDLRGFPKEPAKPTRDALDAARADCLAAGVPTRGLDACSFDLAVTGSKEFLISHLPAAAPTQAPASVGAKPKASELEAHAALFKPDIANPIQTLPNGKRFDVNISRGEQRTYRIDAKRGDARVSLHVISHKLSCVAEEIDGSKPVYQLFDARGRAISKAKATCEDLFSADVKEGDYYLAIKGADAGGVAEVSLEAWAYWPTGQ